MHETALYQSLFSVLLLLLSLLGVLADDAWAFLIRTGPAESPVLPLLVTAVAVLLVWLAYSAGRNGWLR